MWTRGPDKQSPGKFAYELWDGNTMVERVGGFDTHTEADRAAEQAQRGLLFRPVAGETEMAAGEILAELLKGECEREGCEYANEVGQEYGEPAVCIHCGDEKPC